MAWSKKILEWTEGNKAFLSVVFTWQLPEAWSRCVWYRQQGYEVVAGGPAVALMPNYLSQVSTNHVSIPMLSKHNPEATRTSIGCINRCEFCAVWRTEGDLKELDHWEPKPIVCDNNLLACSQKHFNKVIDSLKGVQGVDFNQGLDCRELNTHHIERITELNLSCIRFSWDYLAEETQVFDALKLCADYGIPKSKIRIYVLINHKDDPENAHYRLKTLKDYGLPKSCPMRFQPVTGDHALVKDSFVEKGWTDYELTKFMHFWFKQRWLGGITYEEFRG